MNLKRTILLVAILTLTSTFVAAQHFGVQGGGVLSNIKWRNDVFTVNTFVKPGFLAGIAVDFPLNNNMAISTALNYKWVGAALSQANDLSSLRLGYINLDFTYNYIFDLETFQIYLEGGGYAAYLANAESIYKPEGQDAYSEEVKIGYDETDEIIPFDFGIEIGGGFYLGKWKLGLGYQTSLIDLSPNNEQLLWNKIGTIKATYFFNRNKPEEG